MRHKFHINQVLGMGMDMNFYIGSDGYSQTHTCSALLSSLVIVFLVKLKVRPWALVSWVIESKLNGQLGT